MNPKMLLVWAGIFLCCSARLGADQVELQNGDHFSGRILTVSADAVVLENDALGKITVPRQKIARLAFGTNAVAPVEAGPAARVTEPTNLPPAAAVTDLLKTNTDLSATLRQSGADTNVIQKIRAQMLAGSPEAAAKYDELVSGLMSGKMDMQELRREAQSSAEQLRELKRSLGPDAGDSLDGYLQVLDQFLKESAAEPTNAAPAAKMPVP